VSDDDDDDDDGMKTRKELRFRESGAARERERELLEEAVRRELEDEHGEPRDR
jgi:hypothetical protein